MRWEELGQAQCWVLSELWELTRAQGDGLHLEARPA